MGVASASAARRGPQMSCSSNRPPNLPGPITRVTLGDFLRYPGPASQNGL